MEMLTIDEGPSREELFDSIRRSLEVFFIFATKEASGSAQVFSAKKMAIDDGWNNHLWYISFSVGFKTEYMPGKPYFAYYTTGKRKGFIVEKEIDFEVPQEHLVGVKKGDTPVPNYHPISADELYVMLRYFEICPTQHERYVYDRLDKAIPGNMYPRNSEAVTSKKESLLLLLHRIKKSAMTEKHLPDVLKVLGVIE